MHPYVHRHPVVQKVVIGMFVWGMSMFGIRVAYGQNTFPLPTDLQRIPITEIKLPIDLPPAIREELDKKFETGDVPTQQDFGDAIDSRMIDVLRKQMTGMAELLKVAAARIEVAKAKGVTVSPELVVALEEAQSALVDFEHVTSPTSAEELANRIRSFVELMQKELPKLDMSANMPRVLAQVEKEYTRLQRAVTVQRSRLSLIKVAMAPHIAELDKAVAGVRLAIDASKSQDDGSIMLAKEVYPKFEEAWQIYGSLEALRTVKTALRKIESQVKANDALIARLKSSGMEEAEELAVLQAEIKVQFAALKTLSVSKDVAATYNALLVLSEFQQKFERILAASQDDNDVTNDKIGASNNWGVPQFGPPSGLPGSAIIDVKGLEMLKKMAPYMPKP